MWSPKTPLKLPGKKSSNKYEQHSMQYLLSHNDDDYEAINEDNNNSTNASENIVDFDSGEDTVFIASDSVLVSKQVIDNK
jgi:hypothetical protein